MDFCCYVVGVIRKPPYADSGKAIVLGIFIVILAITLIIITRAQKRTKPGSWTTIKQHVHARASPAEPSSVRGNCNCFFTFCCGVPAAQNMSVL